MRPLRDTLFYLVKIKLNCSQHLHSRRKEARILITGGRKEKAKILCLLRSFLIFSWDSTLAKLINSRKEGLKGIKKQGQVQAAELSLKNRAQGKHDPIGIDDTWQL